MNNESNLKKAMVLIYASLGLDIPSMVLANKYNHSISLGVNEIFFSLIAMSLHACLAYQLGQGKKWAIWTYSIYFFLGLLSIGTLAKDFDINFLYGLVGASAWGLELVALYLIHELKLKSIVGLSQSANNIVPLEIKTNAVILKTSNDVTPIQLVGVNSNDIDDLGKLHELLKSGALTQQEFDEQKKQVFKRAA